MERYFCCNPGNTYSFYCEVSLQSMSESNGRARRRISIFKDMYYFREDKNEKIDNTFMVTGAFIYSGGG